MYSSITETETVSLYFQWLGMWNLLLFVCREIYALKEENKAYSVVVMQWSEECSRITHVVCLKICDEGVLLSLYIFLFFHRFVFPLAASVIRYRLKVILLVPLHWAGERIDATPRNGPNGAFPYFTRWRKQSQVGNIVLFNQKRYDGKRPIFYTFTSQIWAITKYYLNFDFEGCKRRLCLHLPLTCRTHSYRASTVRL
jgi:hypothetical protein